MLCVDLVYTALCVGVMVKLAEYYSNFITSGSLLTEFSIPSEHAMVGDHIWQSHDSHMTVEDGHMTVEDDHMTVAR